VRFWDLSGAEVAAADAEPWDGPLASTMRPFSTQSLVRLQLAGALLFGLSGAAGLFLALSVRSDAAHDLMFIGFNVVAASIAISMVGILVVVSPRLLRHIAPALGLCILFASPFLVGWGVWSGGPRLGVVTVAFGSTPLFAFYMLRRRWAVAHALCVLGCFGAVLWVQGGWIAPSGTWLFLAANLIGTAVVVGMIALRADELAASEHAALVEVDELNHTLEDRVATQVTEIERLGGLRRFLSPQVADVVLSEDSEELGKPHRRRIAVFFCDLRGFTAFTNTAEPEEVIGILDDYYGAVGGLLQRYDATVGDYAGDGIMAYFGDPVPREDSALVAVEMTREIGSVMAGVVAEWKRRGYDLDYGVGLAYGYATLGVVGFDGRYDYKPVGGVVNLAARLCAKAGSGQVLLDHSTYAATSERFASEHFADLDLKGYGAPTKAYALTAV
jgi:class 3 adenylate cyclase